MCDELLLIELECKYCTLRFNICRKCYRGHVYCSSSCRREAQVKAHLKAQSRYRTSNKGREAHSRNEKKRRMGKIQKTMADASTNTPPLRVILYPTVQNTNHAAVFAVFTAKLWMFFHVDSVCSTVLSKN